MLQKKKITILISLFTLVWFSLFQGFTQAQPDGSDSFNSAVLQYYQSGYGPSLKTMRDIFNNTPDNSLARSNVIRLLRESGNFTEAIKLLKETTNPKNPGSRYRLDLMQMTYLNAQWAETIKLSEDNVLNAEELYWRGLALAELGKETEAAQAFTESLEKEPFNPMVNFRLGQFCQKTGDFEKAALNYKKAVAQEPNLAKVYFPLARTYLALQKYQSAYNLLLNAQASYPWDQEIAGALKQFLREHPEIIRQQQAETQKRRQIINPSQVTPLSMVGKKSPRSGLAWPKRLNGFTLKPADSPEYRIPPALNHTRSMVQPVYW